MSSSSSSSPRFLLPLLLMVVGCLTDDPPPEHRAAVEREEGAWTERSDARDELGVDFTTLVPRHEVSTDRAPVELERVAAAEDALPGPQVRVSYPEGEARLELLGPSTVVSREGWLYVGYRKSSVVVRFRLDPDGDLVRPPVGELIAVFESSRAGAERSADLVDLAFDSRGALYASCAGEGRVWRIGVPDPARPFLGGGLPGRAPTAPPYLDLRARTGEATRCGPISFDERDRLYVCVADADEPRRERGAIYRASPAP